MGAEPPGRDGAAARDPGLGRPVLRCRALTVADRDGVRLAGVDLEVAAGELVAVLGPSGAGKSTLLGAVAGLLAPTDGDIWIAGHTVADAAGALPPERRPVAMVFQQDALWPHLSALATVAYPLRRAGVRRAEARDRATELLEQLEVGRLAGRRPGELSGGERQRVGLARALARRAELYLFDEPTAHLDPPLRAAFQALVRDRQRRLGAAALYATHDATEALALADRMVLLVDGRVVQVGPPARVYAEPADQVAARLTGPVAVLTGQRDADGTVWLDLGAGPVPLTRAQPVSGPHGPVRVLVRPEWAAVPGRHAGSVAAVWFRGHATDYAVDTPAGAVLLRQPGGPRLAIGEPVRWELERGWVVPAGDGAPAAQPRSASAPR